MDATPAAGRRTRLTDPTAPWARSWWSTRPSSVPNQAPDFGEALVALENVALILGEVGTITSVYPMAAYWRNRCATGSTPPWTHALGSKPVDGALSGAADPHFHRFGRDGRHDRLAHSIGAIGGHGLACAARCR
jgi:hypothetical protein